MSLGTNETPQEVQARRKAMHSRIRSNTDMIYCISDTRQAMEELVERVERLEAAFTGQSGDVEEVA